MSSARETLCVALADCIEEASVEKRQALLDALHNYETINPRVVRDMIGLPKAVWLTMQEAAIEDDDCDLCPTKKRPEGGHRCEECGRDV
jgi:hypothetical protein